LNKNLIIRNGNEQSCLPNTLNLSFSGINAKQLVNQLSDRLAFSTGSACHEDTKHQTMSTTLKAIGNYYNDISDLSFFYSILLTGLSWELARGTIRLSTSYMTTDDEVDQSIILITNAVKQQLSSFTNGHDQ
jgi:cysteine desulfurase